MRFHRQTLTVDEAVKRLLTEATPLPAEEVGLHDALGRTLAEDLYATCDLPPFDRAAMDGYAVRAADTKGAAPDAPARLRVVETIAAGNVPKRALQAGEASRIMTGAMLPPGSDAVVMFEQTVRPGERLEVVEVKRELTPGENISARGEEVAAGDCVLRAGEPINAGAIAVLATFGMTRVPVVRRPRIGLLSTGSELLAPDHPLVPGKIRNSNGPMLAAMIREADGEPVMFQPLPDDREAAMAAIAEAVEQVDVLVTTGGVSVGDFDIIASLAGETGVELLFNRVAMRPGSPTTVLRYRDTILCGLSGNPGACFVGFHLFVRPLIRAMLGKPAPRTQPIQAVLAADYDKPCPFPRYLRGTLYTEGGALYVSPDFRDKSGMLSTLKDSECLVVIPAGGRGKRAGETVQVIPIGEPGWRKRT